MTQAEPIGEPAFERRDAWLDLIVAVTLASLLTLSWAINDWTRLGRMLLPDPDDMMRLAQVRDWLAGQGINDWTQYRMAPPHGAPMHWSRINDLGIAGLILAATPLVGRAHAEAFAVLTYPGLLFACVLFLSARIGRRLWGAQGALVAAVLTALAYPGTTVFVPGRIDHHALQVVLIQLLVLLLMRAPSAVNGIAMGFITGISLVVGLETAPHVAALVGVLAMFWVVRGMDERIRLGGFAGGLGGTTLVFLIFLRPTYWTASLCDAFTPASLTGTLAVALALAALSAATPLFPKWRIRIVVGAASGAGALGATLALFPGCISGPYGAMDPFLLQAFMPYIDEANGILAQPRIARVIAIGGMLTAACVATVWMVCTQWRRWPAVLPIAAVVLMSGLVILSQVRGGYIGAPLGAPVLAGLVVAARQRTEWRLPAVIGAWLAGAGIAWGSIPYQVEKTFSRDVVAIDRPKPQVACSAGGAWAQIDRLPPGVTMAGTSVAAYLVGATRHSTIGAGYHRNNAGNMAMYRFFLRDPAAARKIASVWDADYVAFCPGDFLEIDVARNFPNSLAAELHRGRAPAWLQLIPLRDTPLRFYRIR